ncbi:hypothetical protein ACNOYE_02240 [Nannocystaceae bacterium ST9]
MVTMIGVIGALLALLLALADDERDRESIAARVQALPVAPLAAGAQGELSLLLLESPEPSLPLALRIDAGSVALVENRVGWSAVVDPQALQPRLRAPFSAPSEPGTYGVRASVDYQVCAGEWCRHKRGEVEWTIEVLAPMP